MENSYLNLYEDLQKNKYELLTDRLIGVITHISNWDINTKNKKGVRDE